MSGIPVIDYSDVGGGYPGTANIDVDPGYVNPASGDYHLGFASPCALLTHGAGIPRA